MVVPPTAGTRTAEQAQESFAVTIKVIHAVAVFRRLLRDRQRRLGLRESSSPPSPPSSFRGAEALHLLEQPACPTIGWDELEMGRLIGKGALSRRANGTWTTVMAHAPPHELGAYKKSETI